MMRVKAVHLHPVSTMAYGINIPGILAAIGVTPLVKLNRVIPQRQARVLVEREFAREEGLLGGISTGANVAVAARLAARRAYAGKTIVTFARSAGERYLSTPLYELVGMPDLPPALVG